MIAVIRSNLPAASDPAPRAVASNELAGFVFTRAFSASRLSSNGQSRSMTRVDPTRTFKAGAVTRPDAR